MVTIYLILSTPAFKPDTRPVLLIVATLLFTLYHKPPEVAFVNADFLPAHISVLPLIGAITGNPFTFIVVETESVQP